uniref:Uncharacterized protein n=1 Tax=Romanomermis culicivorax TaxID=13658 RepID=A0A915K2U9_ROMCU
MIGSTRLALRRLASSAKAVFWSSGNSLQLDVVFAELVLGYDVGDLELDVTARVVVRSFGSTSAAACRKKIKFWQFMT